MSEEINFGDLIASVAEANAAKAKVEREVKDAAAAEAVFAAKGSPDSWAGWHRTREDAEYALQRLGSI